MPKGYCKDTGLPTNPNGRKRMDYLKHYDAAPSGCWVWRGATVGQKGYGYIRFPEGARMAHRFFYENHVGQVPDGLVLDHLCRNRRCVNPHHLEPVTSRENTMRGDTPARANAEKKRCKRGHKLRPRIDSRTGRTVRRCLECSTKTMRRKIQAERQGMYLGAPRKITDVKAAKMRIERKAGMTPAQLARKYKISVGTVNKYAPKGAR